MDNEAGERKRGRTLELKGEGQGFTLRRYPIVLKETVIRAIKILKHDVTKAEVVTVSLAALLKSIRKYKKWTCDEAATYQHVLCFQLCF